MTGFEKNDHVTIVYMENSVYNEFKGYNGMIKEIIADSCIVIVEALNCANVMKLNKNQLIYRK